MTQEVISAVLSGVTSLITAVGGVLILRNRRRDQDAEQDAAELIHLRKENKWMKKYNLAATRHMYRLEMMLASRDIDPPERPETLDDDPDVPDRPRSTGSGPFPVPPTN